MTTMMVLFESSGDIVALADETCRFDGRVMRLKFIPKITKNKISTFQLVCCGLRHENYKRKYTNQRTSVKRIAAERIIIHLLHVGTSLSCVSLLILAFQDIVLTTMAWRSTTTAMRVMTWPLWFLKRASRV